MFDEVNDAINNLADRMEISAEPDVVYWLLTGLRHAVKGTEFQADIELKAAEMTAMKAGYAAGESWLANQPKACETCGQDLPAEEESDG